MTNKEKLRLVLIKAVGREEDNLEETEMFDNIIDDFLDGMDDLYEQYEKMDIDIEKDFMLEADGDFNKFKIHLRSTLPEAAALFLKLYSDAEDIMKENFNREGDF